MQGLGRRSACLTFPNTALAGFRRCQSPIANCVGKFCSGCWNAGPDRRVLCITEHQEEKMTEKKVMHKGVENRAIGIWDDLYRGLPGPVKSFLSVIIVSTTLMLGALFFTTQLLPGADSLIPTLVDALERQIEGQNVKNEQLEILARKMVQIAASVQQLTEELAQSNDRFQSSVDALRRDVTILQEHCHGSGGGSCQ